MSISKTAIRKWLKAATPEQIDQLVKAAKTSREHLRHVAAGRRGISAEFAQTMALASRTLHVRALYLDQREICTTCAKCPIVAHDTVKPAPTKAPAKTPKAKAPAKVK